MHLRKNCHAEPPLLKSRYLSAIARVLVTYMYLLPTAGFNAYQMKFSSVVCALFVHQSGLAQFGSMLITVLNTSEKTAPT